MKINQLLLILLMVVFTAACNQQLGKGYTITGDIKGLPESSRIQLIPVSHEREVPLVDTLVVNGKFEFKGTVEEPRAFILKLKDGYGFKYLMLENCKIKIEGEVTRSDSNGNISYDFSNVSISGSALTDYYAEQLSIRSKMDKMYNAYITKYSDVMNIMGNARREKNQPAIDSIAATDEYKAMAQAEKEFFTAVEFSYKETIMRNKDTYWGPLLMITLMSYFTEEQKSWYEVFSPEAKESYYGKKVFDELYPAGSIGTQVAEFDVKIGNRPESTFAGLRQGKKYILLDFWASWCNPCLREFPHLKKLYSEYSNKGFEIVSISIDEKELDWKKKSDELQLPWPSFLDTEDIATLYNVRTIPAMYLVDEQGVLVAENLRAEFLATKLTELFYEK